MEFEELLTFIGLKGQIIYHKQSTEEYCRGAIVFDLAFKIKNRTFVIRYFKIPIERDRPCFLAGSMQTKNKTLGTDITRLYSFSSLIPLIQID